MPDPNADVDADKRATLRRFAAVGAATPLAGLGSEGDASSDGSDVRDAIRGYVSATPGAHFSKLRDDLELGTGETQHHLQHLLDEGVLVSRREDAYRRFFIAGRFSAFERTALGYLRRETPRGMVLTLLRNPAASASDIAADLGVSRATVSTHAARLDEAGLLDREGGYSVARPETLIALLVRYADSFDDATRAFAADVAEFVRYDP
jgi:predicted transcriptional regulator